MDDKVTLMIGGILFLVLQFIFQMIQRSSTKEITTAISIGIGTFKDHVDESTEMFTLIKSLSSAHDVKDQDGRPMWYMPHSLIETQNELTKIVHVIAQTQKATVNILERMERKLDATSEEIKKEHQP